MLNSYREDVNVLATTVGGATRGAQPYRTLPFLCANLCPCFWTNVIILEGGRHRCWEGLYPDVVSYNIFVGQFLSFKHESEAQSIRRLVSSGHCVIMQGAPLERAGTGSLLRLCVSSRSRWEPQRVRTRSLKTRRALSLWRQLRCCRPVRSSSKRSDLLPEMSLSTLLITASGSVSSPHPHILPLQNMRYLYLRLDVTTC